MNLTFNENLCLKNKVDILNKNKSIVPGYSFPWTIAMLRQLFINAGITVKQWWIDWGINEGINPFSELQYDIDHSLVFLTDEKWKKIQEINTNINSSIQGVYDINQYGVSEFWNDPTITGKGDCISINEEIYTDRGLTKVAALKIGDMALSYDFDKKEYCYKPIKNIWEKGKLPVFRVNFRGGAFIDVTENHPFWVRTSQLHSKYEKKELKDIDLERWWKRKIPCVKELPYEIDDIGWLNEDLCFVIGHFLAEGYVDNGHVRTSGYDVPEFIIPLLEKNNIPFSVASNNSGVPYLSFLQSDFKDYLRTLKINSFNIKLPENVFKLPKNKLKAIINGHFLGDGHNGNYSETSNKQECYSTSSYDLVFDIQRIHLQLGIPIHMWLQENHQGVGNKPIWRLSYNPNSCFSRDFGYDGLSEISIKNYEYLGEIETRDFEVEDTHTFINKFGILSHNCEDYCIAKRRALLLEKIPAYFMTCFTGSNEYHAVLCIHTDKGDFILDNLTNSIVNCQDKPYRFEKIQGVDGAFYQVSGTENKNLKTPPKGNSFMTGAKISAPHGYNEWMYRGGESWPF